LHKRLDLVMQNISLLYYIDQQPLKPSYIFNLNNSFNFYHINNQLKSSIAELRILKNEILIYKQIYDNIKYFLVRQIQTNKICSIINEKTGTKL
jgi:hypothetical protein